MKISKSLFSHSFLANIALTLGYCFAKHISAMAEEGGPVQVAGSPAQAASAPAWINFVLIGGIIVFMWLFVFRPQSKRAKEQKDFLASLAPGLEVITSGGIIGTIIDVQDSIVSINIGNSTVRVLKSSISGKLDSTAVKAK